MTNNTTTQEDTEKLLKKAQSQAKSVAYQMREEGMEIKPTTNLLKDVLTQKPNANEFTDDTPISDGDVSNNEVIDYTDSLKALTAGYTDALTDIQSKQDKFTQTYQDYLQESEEEKKSFYDKITDKFKGVQEKAPDYQDLFKKTMEEYGFDPADLDKQRDLINKVVDLEQQIADFDTEAKLKVAQAENTAVSLPTIRGRVSQIEREAAIKKSGLAAQASVYATEREMLQGNLDQARSLAQQTVSYASQQYQQKLSDFQYLMSMEGDLIDSLDESDKEMFNLTYQQNQQAYETAKQDIQNKMNLVIDAASKGVALNIDVNSPYEDVVKAYSRSVSAAVQPTTTSNGESKEFSLADEYANQRTDLGNEDLKKELLRDSDLNISEINSIIDSRRRAGNEDLKTMAEDYVANLFDKSIWKSRATELSEAKDKAIEVLKDKEMVEWGDRQIWLSEKDKEVLLSKIRAITDPNYILSIKEQL